MRWRDPVKRAAMIAAMKAPAAQPQAREKRKNAARRVAERRHGPRRPAATFITMSPPIPAAKQALRAMLAQAVANTIAPQA